MPQSAGWHFRQHVWRHNGLRGSLRFCRTVMWRVINATSTTADAREVALALDADLGRLETLLQTRIDPK